MLLDRSNFLKFVCCNNNGGSDHDVMQLIISFRLKFGPLNYCISLSQCAKDLGVDPSVLDDCVNKKQSDQLLMDNGNRRRKAGIPGCHVPEFSFNNVRP